jgi:glycerate 2-kinase
MSTATIHNKRLLLKQNSGVQSLKFALVAVEVALKSVDPFLLIKNSMKLTGSVLCINDVDCRSKKFDLSLFDRIYIVGAGKATAGMSEAVIHVLGGGAITIPYDISTRRSILSITHAGHPLPDKNGLAGTKKILSVLDNVTSDDLVIVLISGGGSALMPLPVNGITLAEKQKITSTLLASGASIDEINVIRKHLSAIKGGRLAKFLRKGSTLISLIMSDVVDDRIDIIASGPTAPDKSTFHDAKLVLQKYKLWNNWKVASKSVMKIMDDGIKKKMKIHQNLLILCSRKYIIFLLGVTQLPVKVCFRILIAKVLKLCI